MRFFLSYLKSRAGCIGLFSLFGLCYVVVLSLYALPVGTIVYPLVLCAFFALIALLWDYQRISRRHRALTAIDSMTNAQTIPLPEPHGILETDYQHILRLLCQEHSGCIDRTNAKYQDMMDYYTVWAHQIKTPIASMRLNLQNEDSALARRLSAELTEIEQYVEMVLTFLRLDSDSTDYVIREHDLDTIVRQAVRKFAGAFIARKLKLVYEPMEKAVITDEKWLGFVVEQVLSNALKYPPSGSIRIYLEDGETLCIQDTGIGIAPEDLPRIFEKGFTGYHGRSDRKASGIGLYLCRRVCKNLGHAICAQSTPGVGTTVRIELRQRDLETE